MPHVSARKQIIRATETTMKALMLLCEVDSEEMEEVLYIRSIVEIIDV